LRQLGFGVIAIIGVNPDEKSWRYYCGTNAQQVLYELKNLGENAKWSKRMGFKPKILEIISFYLLPYVEYQHTFQKSKDKCHD